MFENLKQKAKTKFAETEYNKQTTQAINQKQIEELIKEKEQAKSSFNIAKIESLNKKIEKLEQQIIKNKPQIEENKPLTLENARNNLQFELLKNYLSDLEEEKVVNFLNSQVNLSLSLKQNLKEALSIN